MNFLRHLFPFPGWSDFKRAQLDLISSSESHVQLTRKAFASNFAAFSETSPPPVSDFLKDVQRGVCATMENNEKCAKQMRGCLESMEQLRALHAQLDAKAREAADVEKRERNAVRAVARAESNLLATRSKNANDIRAFQTAFDAAVADERDAKRCLDEINLELAEAKKTHGKAVSELVVGNLVSMVDVWRSAAEASAGIGKRIREGAERLACVDVDDGADLGELEKLRRKAQIEE